MSRDNFFNKIDDAFRNIRDFIFSFKKIFIVWTIFAIFILLGVAVGLDKKVITFFAIIFGILSQAFIGLINLIALIPFIGPLIAKVLAVPFYWLLNALGYFVSIIAIKKGFKKDVINYRVLTIVFLVGVTVGFIMGKLL